MAKDKGSFLSSNYFERAEFTKIEVILLVGVILIFLPFVWNPFDDKMAENANSVESENRIVIAFGIAMFLLILTMILSRKGYTSYTPWLEKLANDKLEFDLKLFQHIDTSNKKKVEKFFIKTFEKKDKYFEKSPMNENDVDKSVLFGWKPIDENKKWYSVFTEKLDYRFYEIAFSKLWPEWCKENYVLDKKDENGDYIVKINRPKKIYGNPELVPDFSSEEIKKEIETKKSDFQKELGNKKVRLEEIKTKLKSKTKKTKDLENQVEVESKKLNEEKINITKKLEEVEVAKKETKEKQKKFDGLEKKLGDAKFEVIKNLEQKLEKAEKELEAKKLEKKQNESDVKELEKTREKLDVEDESDQITDDEIKTLNEKLAKFNIAQNDLDNKIKTLNEEIETVRDDLEDEKQSNSTIDDELKTLKEEIKTVGDDLEDSSKDLSQKAIDSRKTEELDEIQKDLDKTKKKLEDSKSKKIKQYETEFKEVEARKIKLEVRLELEMGGLGENETCLDAILKDMDIFEEGREGNIEHEEEVRKLLVRKIQNDILYYSVMINFRRGLQKATEEWLKADNELRITEKNRIDADAQSTDAAGEDLKYTVKDIIQKMENEMIQSRDSYDDKKNDDEKQDDGTNGKEECTDCCDEDSEEKKVQEKIDFIQGRLINRNEWETPEWRAMGSIYYKWREDGEKAENKGKEGIEEADKTVSERISDWWDKEKGLGEKSEVDPTEKRWKEHRTIRAVNSLSLSFGFDKEKKGTGKAIVFFGIVFALIISTALLNSLDIVIETLQIPEDCGYIVNGALEDCYHAGYEFFGSNANGEYQFLIILFLCFFPLGILFYHQGTIFLSAKAAEELTLGNKPLIFMNFIVILIQAVVVYFLASSIGDVNAFLTLLGILVTIDAIWVSIFTWNDMRDAVRDSPVYLEWIIFDIIIGMFALVFLTYYSSTAATWATEAGITWEQNWPIFVMLLLVLITRAGVDYSYAWKNFWSMFADAE